MDQGRRAMSTVDVVVPCYNYGRFLERCVYSALDQPGVDVRVLVIDDTSKDDSAHVGRALAARDPRIEFRRHEINKGHIATYNEGLLGWVNSDYCILLSADDLLAPGALGRAVALMDANPDVHLAYGLAMIITDDQDLASQKLRPAVQGKIIPGQQFLKYCMENTHNPVPTPTAVVRSRIQKLVGGYKKELPHTGDEEMWMRFAANGDVAYFDCTQAYYRRHGANMSVQYYSQSLGDRREWLLATETALTEWSSRIPKAAEWSKAARAKLAEETFWYAVRAFDDGDSRTAETYANFVIEVFPDYANTHHWKRFATKRRMGARLWKIIGPMVDAVRGNRVTPYTPPQRLVIQPGEHEGWCPETA